MLATVNDEPTSEGEEAPRVDGAKRQFAERLIAVMEKRGLSIAETARRIRQHLQEGEGFTDANLVHYRQGRSMPRPRYLEALSRALEVEPTELMSGSERGSSTGAGRQRRQKTSGAPVNPNRREAQPDLVQHGSVVIEDFGDEVHLKIDQRLPWSVALQILQAIKGSSGG